MACESSGDKVQLTTVQDYSSCFMCLHILWKDNLKEEFHRQMHANLTASTDPSKMALVCVKICPDLYKSKNNSLAANILIELQHFLQGEGLPQNEEHQWEAFDIAMRTKNAGLIRQLVKSYQLVEFKDSLLPVLKDKLKEGQVKEVCFMATLLQLQDSFSTDELVVPLFLQDRLPVADELLASSADHQQQLLTFLDHIIGGKVTFHELEKKYSIKDRKKVTCKKTISGVMAKLLKRFQLDSTLCPHFLRYRAVGSLRFLFYKFYIDKGIQRPTFNSLVSDTLKEHHNLVSELMNLFMDYCDAAGAVPFVNQLQLSLTDLPPQIREAVEQVKAGHFGVSSPLNEESWEEELEDYYSLTLPLERVVLVDAVEGFEECVKSLASSSLLAIDSEWKPNFGIGTEVQAALLQCATTTHVFLLDLLALQHVLDTSHWQSLAHPFTRPEVIKLGYGLFGDMKVLANLHPEMKKGLAGARNMVDLDRVKGTLLHHHPAIFLHPEREGIKGLSDLCQRCFGRPLNKQECLTNWADRPLTSAQVLYAAIDAWCLVDLYHHLDERADLLGIPDWKDTSKKTSISPEKKKKTKCGGQDKQRQPGARQMGSPIPPAHPGTIEPVTAANFRVICDTMVQGLAKQLRSCGVDACMVATGEGWEQCLQSYEQEGRVVLTRGQPYHRLRKHIPSQYVYNVQSETASQQLQEIIKTFNVKVTLNDVFAHCSKCNSNSYLILSSETIASMRSGDGGGGDWVECQRGGKVHLQEKVTEKGVRVQVEKVQQAVLDKTEEFYVCAQCGKCYWEGSHHTRVVHGRLKGILESESVGKREEGKSEGGK